MGLLWQQMGQCGGELGGWRHLCCCAICLLPASRRAGPLSHCCGCLILPEGGGRAGLRGLWGGTARQGLGPGQGSPVGPTWVWGQRAKGQGLSGQGLLPMLLLCPP